MIGSIVKPFKIVLLGDSAVGKSSLVIRFVEGQFTEFQQSTVGAAYLTKTVTVDNATVKLEIWDTAGQERYRSLAPMYYRGALGAVVTFDLTNQESFEAAQSWIDELRNKGADKMIITLVGNKADMKEARKVSTAQGEELAKQLGINFYIETSAKTGHNVDALFEALAKSYLDVAKDLLQDDDDVIGTIKGLDVKPRKARCNCK